MKTLISIVCLISVVTLSLLFFDPRSFANDQNQTPPVSREDAYRANNFGVALLEQFKYREAADAFRRALQIDPKLALARINLSIALFNVPDLAGAL
ncbi:MAG TPA: tetratricopeptide repeat protein, partial [Pyrinomonadaceae bacterium]